MPSDLPSGHRGTRLLLGAAFLALVIGSGCPRGTAPAAPTDATSLILVTFGHVPDGAFAVADPSSQTPSFDRLAEEPGMRRILAAQKPVNFPEAASLRKRGYDTAAFVADPALTQAASAFATSAVPTRPRREPIRLSPSPFERPHHIGFAHGDAVADAGLAWLAAQAGLPSPAAAPKPDHRKAADKAATDAKPAPAPALKRPVFLWLHFADPVFRGTPEHIRVGGSAPAVNPEVAFMDLQLGRLLEFLSKNGLSGTVRLAAACIQGEPASADDAETGAWAARPLPAILPEGDAFPLPFREADSDTAPAPKADPREGLAFRMRHPAPADTNLLADCEAWRDAHPADAEAWGWLGVAQAHAKDFKAAAESHAKALELAPASAFRMSNLGLAYLGIGDIAKAIDNLENAYLADTSNAHHRDTLAAVLLRAGIAFSAQESHSEAMACLTRVAYLQPRNPQAYLAIGKENEKLHRPDLARANYRKALELYPRFQPAREALKELDAAPTAP